MIPSETIVNDIVGMPMLSQIPESDGDKDDVAALTYAYKQWMVESMLPRTLLRGTKGMRRAGITFLPKSELESQDAYRNRVERSVLLNAFKKTASFLSGQVFQRDIMYKEDFPQEVEDLLVDVDESGNDLNIFAKRVFMNGVSKGVSLIFVDAPKDGDRVLSRKEEREMGIRPYFREIMPEDVIGWRTNTDNKLTQVRISELKREDKGKFGTKYTRQIRVLYIGRWEVYSQADSGKFILTDKGTFALDIIPLFIFIPGEETTILTGESPIMDLAELNAAHWRSYSDQTNILHVGRVPILFGRHIDLDEMVSGVASMITSDEEGADMKFVEITGASIKAGADDVKQLEEKMALYGLQQLIPRTGNQTATEKALTSSESNSSLSSWATDFEDVLNAALNAMGAFIGAEVPDKVSSVNKEFNLGVANNDEVVAILKSQEQGIISISACFEELKRRGVFADQLEWDDMEAEREKEKQESVALMQLAGNSFGGGDNTDE